MTKPKGGSPHPSDNTQPSFPGKQSTLWHPVIPDALRHGLELPSTTTTATAAVTLVVLSFIVYGCWRCIQKLIGSVQFQLDIPSAVGQVRGDRSKRWMKRQLLLQIGDELTKEDVISAKFLLRDDIARGKLERIQSGRQLIMSLEKYSETQQESTIVVLVLELLQGLGLHPIINKYRKIFREAQEISDCNVGDTSNQCPSDATAEDKIYVLDPVEETSGVGSTCNSPATVDSEKIASVQCTDDRAQTTKSDLHILTHAMAETAQQASEIHTNDPDNKEYSGCSQVCDGQCTGKSDKSFLVTDATNNSEQLSSGESLEWQGSRSNISSDFTSTTPQTRRNSEQDIELFRRDRKQFDGFQMLERPHHDFRLLCELVQLVESNEVRFEDHWLAAEGPHYPLQIKYQASLREHLYARLPELLAAAGRIDGLEIYIQAYGQKTLMRRHTKTWTPLDWAASSGQLQCVEWLTKYNNGINLCHALLWAGQNGHIDVMRHLLQAGADPRFRHPTGDSVLHFASRCGRNKVIQFVLRNAIGELNCDYETFFGQYTPLHEAAARGQSCTVQMLLGQGANVNALSQMCETPLMLAVKEGERNHRHCVQILLQHGADAAIQDKDGKTVFDYATKNPDCLLTMLQYGALPHTKTEMETVDSVITLQVAKSLRREIIPSVECQWHKRPQVFTPKTGCLAQTDVQARRQLARFVLLQLRENEFQQHGTILMWTCGALHLVEVSLVGQQTGLVRMDVYLHLQLLFTNMLQQACWNPTPKTVLLFADKDGQFQFEG